MFLTILTSKLGKYGIIMLLIGCIFVYINILNSKITNTKLENVKLNNSITILEQTEKELRLVFKVDHDSNVSRIKLNDMFLDHDVEALMLKKPNLIENIINKATHSRKMCFDFLMNIHLTNKELQHEKYNNRVCPNIFNRKL